jgi:hypothetical protein
LVAAALAAALGGCSAGRSAEWDRSDWERKNEALLDKQEDAPALPAFPSPASLIEFEVGGQREFRFYVDPASVSVDPKGIVRYTLVARSPSGAENVTFEGLNCRTAEYRVYALGQPGGSWGGRAGNWRSLAESRQLQRRNLHRDYFCPLSEPIGDADEGRQALREGGNSRSKSDRP